VLGAHGIAGMTGILFIGFFAQRVWNGHASGLLYGHPAQLLWQGVAALAGPAYAFAATFLILKLLGLAMPLRAASREQALGMDVVQHGEQAYTDGEGAILLSYEEVNADTAVAGAAVAP
jgi:ammonium transporter, Amt family